MYLYALTWPDSDKGRLDHCPLASHGSCMGRVCVYVFARPCVRALI